MWHSAIRSRSEDTADQLCVERHCLVLTSDVQGLNDVLHEAETFGTWDLILNGSTAQVRTFTNYCTFHPQLVLLGSSTILLCLELLVLCMLVGSMKLTEEG